MMPTDALLQCDYYDAWRCRSCTLLETPYSAQLRGKQTAVEQLLEGRGIMWMQPQASRHEGFRNKAKMVVAGSVDEPTLGILAPDGTGIDLRDCGLHEQSIVDALPVLASFVAAAGLTPYDVPARRGELKHVLVTASPAGDLAVRFVLRSREALSRIRKHLPALLDAQPIVSASVNLQPEHKAIIEGDAEIALTEQTELVMQVNGIGLTLRPRSFFQTNTAVAAALYREAAAWIDEAAPASVLDLYCGVGGFALHVAGPGREVSGVEVSGEAIESARSTAARIGADASFAVGDATTVDLDVAAPDTVIVNPPRRGIGDLAPRLDASGVRRVLYSSCNPVSLAKDLAAMPSFSASRGRLFDMFPQTGHSEVLVMLERS